MAVKEKVLHLLKKKTNKTEKFRSLTLPGILNYKEERKSIVAVYKAQKQATSLHDKSFISISVHHHALF